MNWLKKCVNNSKYIKKRSECPNYVGYITDAVENHRQVVKA